MPVIFISSPQVYHYLHGYGFYGGRRKEFVGCSVEGGEGEGIYTPAHIVLPPCKYT